MKLRMGSYGPYQPPLTPLSEQIHPAGDLAGQRRSLKMVTCTLPSSLCVLFSVLLILTQSPLPKSQLVKGETSQQTSSFESLLAARAAVSPPGEAIDDGVAYPWTSRMLSWQRTAFHFQPQNSWMNDPNAPLYHRGWYHLFYQYNPSSAFWVKNITWGHAVSTDMIHWLYLPTAMLPDHSYDLLGVWTGSATTLPDGRIMVVYTGNTHVQVQNLAYPANLSDPLLLNWTKYPGNPVILPPPDVGLLEFRDPTTAWADPESDHWFLTIGSRIGQTGVAFLYQTADFTSYNLLDGFLHLVPNTGMWECVDFFPISTVLENGSDLPFNGSGIKHVFKASLYDETHDYYAIGTYDPIKNKWTPDYPELDIGKGLRVDYGKCYASKTFYDQNKRRRILFAWIGESDSQDVDIAKGWASLQGIPRTLKFDNKTGSHLLQWPIEEVESLRLGDPIVTEVDLQPGSLVPINLSTATQLDIVATFEVDNGALEAATKEPNFKYNCNSSGGAVKRGTLGPFGIVVVADEVLTELTPVYFYIHKGDDGNAETHFCTDLTRSSLASGVVREVYGNSVPVIDEDKYSARILVDHSIVESFAQGGRTVITSRVYPTQAIYESTRVFLFNNATSASVQANVKIWQMKSAGIKPFPF